ncbi:MAG TPA: hypothetical protein VG733_11150 [Chthoniobacteraceae bacterium]|nr:hypothetical protein [Chthoniobacteraceae bacterium]
MSVYSNLVEDVFTVLPYALAVVGFYLFLRSVYHVQSPIRPLFFWPIIFSLAGTGVFMIWGHYRLIASEPVKAAVGHIFPPFYSPLVYSMTIALAGYVVAWLLFYLFRFAMERLRLFFKLRSQATQG